MPNSFSKKLPLALLAVGALCSGAVRAEAGSFTQVNLVSDIPGLAIVTDSNLVNPWGVSHSATSPFWVSNQGTNTSTLYAVTDKTTVSKVAITVTIPTTSSGPQGPTGQVYNGNTASFLIGSPPASAHFIFANLNGTISAWNGGPSAIVEVTTPGAVYTGLAINGAQTRLYAANDAGSGSIDVFDNTFTKVTLLASGAFVDPDLPAGLVPFNVQDILGDVYVTYAPAGRPAQTMARLGQGAVAVFTEDGTFIKQLLPAAYTDDEAAREEREKRESNLAAPWGIALAPAGFGRFGGDLLVGNFSYLHSEINAYDPTNGRFAGTLPINTGGHPAGGLWALAFGVGGNNGDPDTLYVTDGINSEMDGLFAAIYYSP